ncbi:MAG: hypothetical protein ACK4JB_12095 [Reyranella sp.]
MRGFVIGFPKCGTTTIHEACVRSGLRSAHWRMPGGYCGQLIYERYLTGQDPLVDFKDYDIVTQADVCRPANGLNFWPNLDIALLLTIRRYHPECCFILNVRDTGKLISSITRWYNLRRVVTESDIVGLPAGYGDKDEHLYNWIEGHYQACRSVFGNDEKFVELPITEDDSSRLLLEKALGTDIKWWGVAPQTVGSAVQTGKKDRARKLRKRMAVATI